MDKDLFKFLSVNEKVKIFFLVILIFFGTILEVSSYALVIPILTIITSSKSYILENEVINNYLFLKNYLLNTDEQKLIFHTVILMVSFFIIKTLYLISLIFFRENFFFNIKARLSKFLYKKYILKEYSDFIKKNTSFYITNILNEVAMVIEKRLRSIVYIFNEILIICFFSLSLLFVNFQMTIIIFMIFVFILFNYLFFTKKKNLKYANIRQDFDFKQIKNLNESFSLFKFLKIHHLEKLFYGKFVNANEQVNNAGKFEIILNEIPKNIFELASIITISSSILYFVSSGNKIIEIIPFLGFLVLAISRIIPSLTRISNSIQNFRFSRPSINVLREELNVFQKNFSKFDNAKINNFESLELDNLSFSYKEKEILKSISIKFKKNLNYCITGETGSGKTTLIDILTGLHLNYYGKIKLNKKILTSPLYKTINISYVPQNIYLIDGTIRENIMLGNIIDKNIDEKLLNKICKDACLENFVNQLKDGYETLIGENGVSISGGQKQRIGLARALINSPELLILDEATNALNLKIACEVIKNLKNKFTTIIVTHDREIAKLCDHKLHLNNGNLEIL